MKMLNIISLAAVSAAITFSAHGATVFIDFTNAGSAAAPVSTGDLLDDGISLSDFPLTVDVVEETLTALGLILVSGSSFDSDNTTINGAAGSFGVNAPTPAGGSEVADRFDVDAAEQLTISFTQDVFLLSADFVNLTGAEAFTVASVTGINDGNTTISDVFDFTSGGTTPGLFFAAGDPILLEATGPAGTSVGLQGLTIETIPEPSSTLLLSAGCVGLLLRRKRR